MMLPLLLTIALAGQPAFQPARTLLLSRVSGNPHSTLSAATALPTTQPLASPQAKQLTKEDSVDVLLEALHQRGINLTGFRGEVTLSDEDSVSGNAVNRAGTILYDAAKGAIRVDFATVQEGSNAVRKQRKIYALVDGWLTDRDYRNTSENRRQVLRPGEKMNLLKLGEGPFPLPIGQEPAEVLKLFDVEPIATDDPRPAIRLNPKDGTKLATKFDKIDVWIDPVTHFPTKIETVTPDGAKTRGTTLTNLQVNPPFTPADFSLDALQGEWNRTEDAYRE